MECTPEGPTPLRFFGTSTQHPVHRGDLIRVRVCQRKSTEGNIRVMFPGLFTDSTLSFFRALIQEEELGLRKLRC